MENVAMIASLKTELQLAMKDRLLYGDNQLFTSEYKEPINLEGNSNLFIQIKQRPFSILKTGN